MDRVSFSEIYDLEVTAESKISTITELIPRYIQTSLVEAILTHPNTVSPVVGCSVFALIKLCQSGQMRHLLF